MNIVSKHKLKNEKELLLLSPNPEYAETVVEFIKAVDEESPFLGRDVRDVRLSVEQMRENLETKLKAENEIFLIGMIDGEMAVECFVRPVGSRVRFVHRSLFGIAVLKKYWGLGIGRIAAVECINWSKNHGYEQIELDTVTTNKPAIALYKDLGFEICGTKKHAMKYADGTYADEHSMVMYF